MTVHSYVMQCYSVQTDLYPRSRASRELQNPFSRTTLQLRRNAGHIVAVAVATVSSLSAEQLYVSDPASLL